jgi:archaellum biogenesis ATPase FlaH
MVSSPFREDRKPSFSYNPERGYGKDFGTDESFDLVSLAQKVLNLSDASEAIAWLREQVGEPPPAPPSVEQPAQPQQSFWTEVRLSRLEKGQVTLQNQPDHLLVRQAREYDGLRHATLVRFGCAIVPYYGAGDRLAFPYPTGCQVYRRKDDAKEVRQHHFGDKKHSCRPSASFFGRKQTRGLPTLLIAKSPREAMLYWQHSSAEDGAAFDVVGLASGESAKLSEGQTSELRALLEAGAERIVIALDRDTDDARAVSEAFADTVRAATGVPVGVLDVYEETEGKAKDFADAVREGIERRVPLAALANLAAVSTAPQPPSLAVEPHSGDSLPAKPEAVVRRFALINPLELERPQRDWVLRGVAARGCLTILGGSPGSGKSMLVQYLLQRRRSQKLVSAVSEGMALYVAGFDASKDELVLRAHSLGGGKGLRILEVLEDPEYVPLMNRTQFVSDLVVECFRCGADAIVFDTVADFHEGDMNDAAKANRTMSAFRQLADRANVAVILITHTRKSTSGKTQLHVNDIADSRIYTSKADFCFGLVSEVTPEETTLVELQTLKARDKPIAPLRFELRCEDDRILFERSNRAFSAVEAVTEQDRERNRQIQQVGELRSAGKTVRETAEILGLSVGAVSKYSRLYAKQMEQSSDSSQAGNEREHREQEREHAESPF